MFVLAVLCPGTADAKFEALDAAGVATVRSPADLGSKMQEILGG